MSPPLSILVVVASPQTRASNPMLEKLLAELDSRPQVDVAVWMLRSYPAQGEWSRATVVDRLRTWPLARAVEMIGLDRAADGLRGARLKWWMSRVRPDGVILDDGLGQRLFPEALLRGPERPVVIERRNRDHPAFHEWEPEPVIDPDVILYTDCEPDEAREVDSVMVEEYLGDFRESRRRGDPDEVARVRARIGIEDDLPIVCGWGDEFWIDGADLFVRVLWILEHHHGVKARGVWFGLGADPNAMKRLQAEAERCGVGDRFQIHPKNDPYVRFCGDVAFLPYRSPVEPLEVREAVASGLRVVTFDGLTPEDAAVSMVPYLDVDAAGAAITPLLDLDRRESMAAAGARFDAGGLADFIVRRVSVRR